MSILDKINGKLVEEVGFLAACILNFWSTSGAGWGIAISMMMYLISRKESRVWNWIKNFAEPTTWPAYVSLGVAALFAAHMGGALGAAIVGALWMTNDGRTFDSLY
jgi:hypothetical protein